MKRPGHVLEAWLGPQGEGQKPTLLEYQAMGTMSVARKASRLNSERWIEFCGLVHHTISNHDLYIPNIADVGHWITTDEDHIGELARRDRAPLIVVPHHPRGTKRSHAKHLRWRNTGLHV